MNIKVTKHQSKSGLLVEKKIMEKKYVKKKIIDEANPAFAGFAIIIMAINIIAI